VDPTDNLDLPALIENLARGLPDLRPEDGLKRLVAALCEHPNPDVREAAAYGLRDYERQTGRKAYSVEPLLAVLGNDAEQVRIREAAAESVGFILMFADRRCKIFRKATRVLVDVLRDPAPEVRFWAAYALGAMRARLALDDLRRVATTDEATCPDWWLVRDEPADAIASILGQPTPERVPEGLLSRS
jgi:HEAT repeat protein